MNHGSSKHKESNRSKWRTVGDGVRKLHVNSRFAYHEGEAGSYLI